MKRTADNAQKRPLAVLRPRDYAELQPPNQEKTANTDCHFPCFLGSGDEGRTEREHRASMGRGGSRIFSTHTYIQMYTWCIFRLRQFWKSEHRTYTLTFTQGGHFKTASSFRRLVDALLAVGSTSDFCDFKYSTDIISKAGRGRNGADLRHFVHR